MKLFLSRTSPYARKVLVLAHEVELADRIEQVVVNPWDRGDDLLQANPLSKVPTLQVSDELSLFDSRVICAYLDTLHEGSRFVPPAGTARWQALRGEALAEGVMDAAIGVRIESLRPEAERSEATHDRLLGSIRRGVGALARELPDLPARPTVAHIGLGCALAYLDLRIEGVDWRAAHEDLARWYTAWADRPSMVATAFPRT